MTLTSANLDLENSVYDCIVVGAGPAGLSGALFLARYRRSVLVLHHGQNRNAMAEGVHGFLGHDGIRPPELLNRGRHEVVKYGGRIVEGNVTDVNQVSLDELTVTVELREQVRAIRAKRLLLATGLTDVLPSIDGFQHFYGKSIHHCPDCDGYEISNKRVAVLSNGPGAVGFALNLLNWTQELTLLTDAAASSATRSEFDRLTSLNIPIREEKITEIEGDIETGQVRAIRFEKGPVLGCDAIFFSLGTRSPSALHLKLGCRMEQHLIWVDRTHQTSVVGVYAAGDITPYSQLTVVAAAEGAMAAIHIHHSLVPADRRA